MVSVLGDLDLRYSKNRWKGTASDPRILLRALENLEMGPAGEELFGEAGESRTFANLSSILGRTAMGEEAGGRERAARLGLGRGFAESLATKGRFETAGRMSEALSGMRTARAGAGVAFGERKAGVLGQVSSILLQLHQQAKARERARKAATERSRGQLVGLLTGTGPIGSGMYGTFKGSTGKGSAEQAIVRAQLGEEGIQFSQQLLSQVLGILGGVLGGGGGGGGLGGLFGGGGGGGGFASPGAGSKTFF